MRPALATAFLALGSAAIGLASTCVAGSGLPMLAVSESVDFPVLDLVARALGLTVGVTALLMASGSSTRRARIALGAVAVLLAIGLVVLIADASMRNVSPPAALAAFVALGIAGAVGLAFAAPRLSTNARALAAGMLVAAAIGLSLPSLRFAWEEYRDEELPRFTLELVAAYPYQLDDREEAPLDDVRAMPAVVVDAEGRIGDVVSLGGERFNLHRGDSLRIDARDVRRVRWMDDGDGHPFISVRVAGAVRAQLIERARARSSQYDAVLIDGVPRSIYFHYVDMPGFLMLSDDDRGRLWHVYEALSAHVGRAN